MVENRLQKDTVVMRFSAKVNMGDDTKMSLIYLHTNSLAIQSIMVATHIHGTTNSKTIVVYQGIIDGCALF